MLKKLGKSVFDPQRKLTSIASTVFSYINGPWHFERLVRGSQVATAKGSAYFACAGSRTDTLHYEERGHLHELKMDFYREYIYKLEDDHLNVYFCKDSCGSGLFHTIVLAKEKERIIGSGEHLCLSDRYTLSYSFPLDRKDPTFIIFCQVIGPRKDYTIETTFSRVSDEKKEPVLT